jgi:transposase
LGPRRARGRPPKDHRLMVEAMVYGLRTGCPWRDLPGLYGPWSSVYTRWRRWCQCGLWGKIPVALARQATGTLRLLDAAISRCIKTPAIPDGGQQNQAMGRTEGGLNTKRTAWVDAAGRAVAVQLAPGQRADVRAVQETVWPRGLRGKTLVADKGYDSWHCGYYRRRHQVENFFQRAKRYRRIGTRYEKRDLYLLSFVQLIAILDWLK